MAKVTGKTKEKKVKPKIGKPEDMWIYLDVRYKLMRDMLGTCTGATLYKDHVLKKNQKNIEKANALGAKITKALEKYKGSKLSPEKEIKEIQKIIATFGAMIGEAQTDLPDNMDELMVIAKDVEEKHAELVKKGEQAKSTIFMKEALSTMTQRPTGARGLPDDHMWPVISTHMLLGNFKENAKIITNQGDKSIFQYKTSVSETLALDVKATQEFMIPDHDIKRNEDGSPFIDERPIRFTNPATGRTENAISSSEVLPEGTEFKCVLRVRKKSPVTIDAIKYLLELGKNNGLGAWRGSGHRGAYFWKCKEIKNYKEEKPKGWN